jgi:hypothetical protein
MPSPALSHLSLAGGIVAALVLGAGAGAEPASPPDFSGGEGGWVHNLNATFRQLKVRHRRWCRTRDTPSKGRHGG